MGDRVTLGLVGLGKQGREHLACAPGCHHAVVVAGCDPDAASREAALALDPGLATYPDIEQMLDAHDLDGLVLALPHHLYGSQWPTILAAGLPILKEKPLGRTVDEAFGFLNSARERGIGVRTAIQRRSHPSYQYLKQALAGCVVESLALDWQLGFAADSQAPGWRGVPGTAGGGVLLDAGYHLVDLAQYLLGPLTLVAAQLWFNGRPLPVDCPENEAMVLARHGHSWVRISAQRGGVKNEAVWVDTSLGRFRATRTGVWLGDQVVFECAQTWDEAMVRQLDGFALAIRERRWDAPTVWEQLPAMQVIEEAYALARIQQPTHAGYSHAGLG